MAHLQINFPVKTKNVGASTTKLRGASAQVSSVITVRPSQLPPVLKKVDSSSSNVAKHTARFISPHESAQEDGVESNISSSGSTLANGFDISGHVLASTQANVRGNATSLEPQSTASTPEMVSKTFTRGKQPTRKESSGPSTRQVRSDGQPDTEISDAGRLQTNIALCADSVAQSNHKMSSTFSDHEKVGLRKQPIMPRSQSITEPHRPRELSMAKPKRFLFTEPTSSTTNVAAQGTIIDQAGSTRQLPQISTSSLVQADQMNPHGASSAPSLLKPRLAPTQPSSSAVLPLGRTKSQLTLLLEREKERSRS